MPVAVAVFDGVDAVQFRTGCCWFADVVADSVAAGDTGGLDCVRLVSKPALSQRPE